MPEIGAKVLSTWKPPVKDERFVSAFVKKIDVFGEVTIKFNTHMRVKNPNITLSHINSTIVDCYIVPRGNWHLTKKNFKLEQLNFTWNVTSYENEFMKLKLNFTDPIQISPGLPYDRFVFHIKEKYSFFFSSEYFKDLHDNYTTLEYGMPKQMVDNSFSRAIVEAGEKVAFTLSWTIVASAGSSVFLNTIVQKILQLISSLQMVLHLPLQYIGFPSNVL